MYGIIKRPNKGLKEKKYKGIWVPKTWNDAPNNLYGEYIWSDGTNIYYSERSIQKVLNRSTSTWEDMTWYGYGSNSLFRGCNIAIVKDKIYVLQGQGDQYLLNKDTHTWSAITFNGYNSIWGAGIWEDKLNNQVYYSSGSDQCVVSGWNNNVITGFTSKSWGLSFYIAGSNIWYNGTDIYYSDCNYTNRQYKINDRRDAWNQVTWNNNYNNSLLGAYIWYLNDNVYMSYNNTQLVLDKENNLTWNEMNWKGLTSFDGNQIWKDGNHVYYSAGSTQYELT